MKAKLTPYRTKTRTEGKSFVNPSDSFIQVVPTTSIRMAMAR